MKKIITLAAIAAVATVLVSCGTARQQQAPQPKLTSAEVKTAEMKAEGWKTLGSRTMQEYFEKYYAKLDSDPDNKELPVVIKNVKTINIARQWAATVASTTYAKQASEHVKGRITGKIGAGVDSPQADEFLANYESLVSQEINGQVQEIFALYRENQNGDIDYQAFYIINEKQALLAREKAVQLALQKEESEFALKNAREISEFVREGFAITAE